MKYFVRWHDEEDYTEVSENFMSAYSEFNNCFNELEKRYYTNLPSMILMFDKVEGNNMYFTRTYIDEEGRVQT